MDNLNTGAKANGVFHVQHMRNGKIIDEWDSRNLVVDTGLQHYHSATLRGGTQVSTWYVGLIGANRTPLAADIITDITENTDYTGNRQTWTPNVAVANLISNSDAPTTFPITVDGTIYGAFMFSAATGTVGTLFAESLFASARAVLNGDSLVITYSVTLSSS